MARANADVQEAILMIAYQGRVGCVIEAARRLRGGRFPLTGRAQLSNHAAAHQGTAGFTVADVEAPHLATHIGRVHAIRPLVAVHVQDFQVAGDGIGHPRQIAVSICMTGMPKQLTGDRVHHIDGVTRRIGAGAVVVLAGVVAAAEQQHQLVGVLSGVCDLDSGRHGIGPGLAYPGKVTGIQPPHELRLTGMGDIQGIVEGAAPAQAEIQIHAFAGTGVDDAVQVGVGLYRHVAVDTVVLVRPGLVVVELGEIPEELRRHEGPLLDTRAGIDGVQIAVVGGEEDQRVVQGWAVAHGYGLGVQRVAHALPGLRQVAVLVPVRHVQAPGKVNQFLPGGIAGVANPQQRIIDGQVARFNLVGGIRQHRVA